MAELHLDIWNPDISIEQLYVRNMLFSKQNILLCVKCCMQEYSFNYRKMPSEEMTNCQQTCHSEKPDEVEAVV